MYTISIDAKTLRGKPSVNRDIVHWSLSA